MCGVLSTDCPHVTAASFEDTLASDDVFVCFFNDFLSLPSFPESLQFNQDTGLFEVVTEEAASVSRNIRLGLLQRLHTRDPDELVKTPLIDNGYTVCCLEPEQGIEWVTQERLPFFLRSDFYFEYRLAKLFLQWEPKLGVQRRGISSAQSERTNGLSSNQAKASNHYKRSASCIELDYPRPFPPPPPHHHPSPNISEPSAHTSEDSCVNEPPKSELDQLAAAVVRQVLEAAVRAMGGHNQANSAPCFTKSEEPQINDRPAIDCPAESKVQLCSPAKNQGLQERDDPRRKSWSKETGGRTQWAKGQDNGSHGNHSNVGKRWALFKEFLDGTPGEGLLHLWMDVERMKATEAWERKSRCLALMRSRYLMSSSQTCLSVELLSRLGLNTSICWTQEKLQSVQPQITHSLFFYWVPRFWTSHKTYEDTDDFQNAPLWTNGRLSSTFTIQTSLYRNETDPPYLSTSPCTDAELCPSRGPVLAAGQMERMIQALCVETYAGLYFTHFCEQSGNRLWENAIYFWRDLQNYHELFYQNGLDPYRVQREAQSLYATFLCSSVERSLGIDELLRRNVYERLTPAFEELFDDVEEHALNVLLEPWTLLVNRDEESYQQVRMQDQTRRVDIWEYRELQSLYEESGSRLKEGQSESALSVPEFSTTLFSPVPQLSKSWSKVPSDYKGYRLGSLLRHRHEIGHFTKFLQNRDAGLHLSCWLDLEQYRRTLQTDTALRRQSSAHLINRYLNTKYFFGSESPASIDQQHDILRLTGGLERLKLDCLLSSAVAMEIQDIVRRYIEATWLPEFLSTAEFMERQKDKPKPHAISRFGDKRRGRQRRRARGEVWQGEGLWMSSSKEILSFRRVLLDPASCLQFQHFVSLKGDFLENDVLFWLEVQRYKDLCHSHSDEATIQKKISTIISVFINSSLPPALQIDIPHDQAQSILENRHKLGPYIFREAQMSVFSELLRFWPEFQDLRSSVREEQLLPLLEQRRQKHRARVRRQKRREEEEEQEVRKAQEEQQKQEPSFRDEVDDEEDDFSDEERSERRPLTTQPRFQFTPSQALTWSYSKYMAALKKEEILLRRKNQLDASFSTFSDSSSCSVKSAGTGPSQKQQSLRSRTGSQQRQRYSPGVKPFNTK